MKEELAELNVATDLRITELLRDSHIYINNSEPTPNEVYYKLLAYAGPPPRENMARGITSASDYIPWVRQVSHGIRTMFPDIASENVYSLITAYADWCRQQGKESSND